MCLFAELLWLPWTLLLSAVVQSWISLWCYHRQHWWLCWIIFCMISSWNPNVMKSHLLLFDSLHVISFADFHLPFISLLVAVLKVACFPEQSSFFSPVILSLCMQRDVLVYFVTLSRFTVGLLKETILRHKASLMEICCDSHYSHIRCT